MSRSGSGSQPVWIYIYTCTTCRLKEKSTMEEQRKQWILQRDVRLPYVRGLSQRLQRTFSPHGVTVHHKPYGSHIRSKLTKIKDHTPMGKRRGVIYHIRSVVLAMAITLGKLEDN